MNEASYQHLDAGMEVTMRGVQHVTSAVKLRLSFPKYLQYWDPTLDPAAGLQATHTNSDMMMYSSAASSLLVKLYRAPPASLQLHRFLTLPNTTITSTVKHHHSDSRSRNYVGVCKPKQALGLRQG